MKFILFFLGLFLISTGCQPQESRQESRRPNMIFIMTDDHAYQAISAYGSRLIQTPNIDRIADEGMRFENAFVTNSICSPSRAVILTGKHSHVNGVRDNAQVFDNAQQTFPRILRGAGYETAVIGKWHLKSPPTGFDYWRVLPDQGHYYQPDFRTPDGTERIEGYVTDIITDLAISWIDSLRDPAKPFMLMYQHKAPHREWWPGPKHLNKFKDQTLPVPETLFDNYQDRGAAARQAEMRISDHMGLTNDNKIPPQVTKELQMPGFLGWYDRAYQENYDRMTSDQQEAWDAIYYPIIREFYDSPPEGEELTKWKFQRYMEDYLASVKSVDENIGRLLDYLDENDLAENTVIVYTSDQGFYLGEHGWFDKRFMYEESFKTPLLIRWPGSIPAGKVNRHLVQNLDFAETLLDIAGEKIPEDMQGESLMPLFKNDPQEWRDAVYYHYYEYPGIHAVKRHYGIRTDQYKLIHFYYDIDEWELYDLKKDPNELFNIFNDPEYNTIRQGLSEKLAALRTKYMDSDALTQQFLEEDLRR